MQDLLIENQNHRHKTYKIIARTLIFSKNQKLHTKTFAKKLDQRAEIKFTKTFAEEIKTILRTYKTNHNKAEEKSLRQSDLTERKAD